MKLIYNFSPLIIFFAGCYLWFLPSNWNYLTLISNGIFLLLLTMLIALVPTIIIMSLNKKNNPDEILDDKIKKEEKKFYKIWSKLILFIGFFITVLILFVRKSLL